MNLPRPRWFFYYSIIFSYIFLFFENSIENIVSRFPIQLCEASFIFSIGFLYWWKKFVFDPKAHALTLNVILHTYTPSPIHTYVEHYYVFELLIKINWTCRCDVIHPNSNELEVHVRKIRFVIYAKIIRNFEWKKKTKKSKYSSDHIVM